MRCLWNGSLERFYFAAWIKNDAFKSVLVTCCFCREIGTSANPSSLFRTLLLKLSIWPQKCVDTYSITTVVLFMSNLDCRWRGLIALKDWLCNFSWHFQVLQTPNQYHMSCMRSLLPSVILFLQSFPAVSKRFLQFSSIKYQWLLTNNQRPVVFTWHAGKRIGN